MQHLSKNRLLVIILVLGLVGFGALGAFAQDGATTTYTVQSGDILDTIAAGFDVQTTCLAEINDLARPDRIKPGLVLLISYDCPPYDGANFVASPRDTATGSDLGQGGGGGAAMPELGPNDQSYTVARGDTLDSIAQQFNVSLQSLQQANGLSIYRTKILIGQELIIPGEAPPYGTFPGVSNPLNPLDTSGQGGGGPEVQPGDEVYVVQPRDVLDSIGAKFDVQVGCLAEANSLTRPNVIYPGQTLVIRMSCPNYDGEAFVENPRSS